MKIKVIILLMVIFSVLNAKEYNIKVYTVSVDVKNNKDNGKAWDVAGGAPDILLSIDGKEIRFDNNCRDKYRCSLEFIVKKDETSWYFEVYDKDLSNNDLIGKGDCKVNEICKLGLATINIVD